MVNPWKKQSNVNPQRENGTRQINSDLLQALMRSNLSGGEFRICLAIIDKTWGFNKSSDAIAISQLVKMTGLADRSIKLIIKQLKTKKMIYYQPSSIRVHHGSPINEFLFNKHYDTWNTQGCIKLHACKPMVSKGVRSCQVRVNDCSPTIETFTKETYTKEKKIYSLKKIFEHWNSKKIIRHRILADFKRYIQKKLTKYSEEEIIQAIDNYADILKSDDYKLSYKWDLGSFLSQRNTFEKFLTINNPFETYKKIQNKFPTVEDIING